VTHPFHPWHGREFVLLSVRQTWSEDRVFFLDYPEAVVIPMPALNGCAVRASACAERDNSQAVEEREELVGWLIVAGSATRRSGAVERLPLQFKIDTSVIALWLGHESIQTTLIYLNSRELHQAGKKPQVAWSAQDGSRRRCAITVAS
jgi:hypothetical protein